MPALWDALPPGAGLALRLAFGLALGSFLNVLIHRLPAGESIAAPGSRCPSCAAPIRWRDNLPVVSYLWLRGRCRACREPIGLRYPLVEIAAAAIVVGAPAGETPVAFAVRTLFLGLLLTLAACDWEGLVLPDALTIPGAVLGVGLAALRPDLGVASSVLGALAGAVPVFALRAVWLRFRGIEAVGRGDIKMLLMIGAFLGPAPTLAAMAAASLLGLVVAGPLLLARRIRRDTPLPFGVLLAVGAAAVFTLPAIGIPVPRF